jgi:hypothetical protein
MILAKYPRTLIMIDKIKSVSDKIIIYAPTVDIFMRETPNLITKQF